MRKLCLSLSLLLAVMILSGKSVSVQKVYAEPESSESASESAAVTYTITAWNDCAIVTNSSGQVISSAAEGEVITVTFNKAVLSSLESFECWKSFSGLELPADVTKTSFQTAMPAGDIIIQASWAEDPKLVSESESVKESEEESRSIESSIEESESIAASQSAAEEAKKASSIAASEYAAKTITVGSYEVYVHVSKVTAPEGFVLANDLSTFSEPVEAFYSSEFETYAYYAKKNEESNYFIYNEMTGDMIPFVTFNGAEDVTYLVISPASELDLPQEVFSSTSVNLSTLISGSAMFVPAWIVTDNENNEHTVLYLVNDLGQKSFYVYDTSSGAIRLTEWNEFKEELMSSEEDESTSDPEEMTRITEETVSSEETFAVNSIDTEEKKSSLKSYAIWLIIIAAIILLLIIAIVVVFYMSKKQEEEEALLDEQEDESETEEDDSENYDSSYANHEVEEETLTAFDFNFEEAFPAEVMSGSMRPTQTENDGKSREIKETDFGKEMNEYLKNDDFEVLDFNRKK